MNFDITAAHDRIFDLLLADDGQAHKEARRYLERAAPELYTRLVASSANQSGMNEPAFLPLYGVIDPEYARVFTMARIIAWQYGYACLMHGSFTRDLDLLMVPWTDKASTGIGLYLIKRIADAAGLIMQGEPSNKLHGRKTWSLLFTGFGDPRWIDISVMQSQIPNLENKG